MDQEYPIVYVDQPEETAWGVIGRSLQAFNERFAGEDHFQRVCFVVQGPGEAILGGVFGGTYWDWLYVELLWVQDELRGRGYGSRLLALAEEEARRRGARNAYLDTFSFQAPDFYRQRGYRIFGELADFPPGHRRYYLTKEL